MLTTKQGTTALFLSLALHLVLIGLPFRFGLLPTGWHPTYNTLYEPCDIFAQSTCSEAEDFAIRDFGVRFFVFYLLACWVGGCVVINKATLVVPLHKVLATTSSATLLLLSFWTEHGFLSGRKGPLGRSFSNVFSMCYVAAVTVSVWTIALQPSSRTESMKWSIPANALFCGAVVALFASVAAFEALFVPNRIERYFLGTVTPAVQVAFVMSACYTATLSVLLLRIRAFLTVQQLRWVCLYKLVVDAVLSMFVWTPESSPLVNISVEWAMFVRVSTGLCYIFGFWWAGKAEGVSRILSSEKED